MNLIDLAREVGINSKWVASTQGGEYHSSCPSCGGDDRFVIQPNKRMKNCVGYYFCRRCNIQGDSIQFCLDYLGVTNFKEAINHLGIEITDKVPSLFAHKKNKASLISLNKPSSSWMQQARMIVEEAHTCLLSQKIILESLNKRGLSLDAIKQYKIGWIPETKKSKGPVWGLEKEIIWLPAGILIPTIEQDGDVIRLKIRRKDWKIDDEFPKYVAISGSVGGLNIIGNKKNPILIVVESELDAYTLHHAVGDCAFIISVGGCLKNPDATSDYLAKNRAVLLICHDNDSAGINMFNKWSQLYSHAQRCTTDIGKDIGEAIQQGLNIRDWITAKLPEQIQIDRGLKKASWSQEDQILINRILEYINERTITRHTYAIFEQEISLGPDSPRAKTGELQNGLRLMRQLIEQEFKAKGRLWQKNQKI